MGCGATACILRGSQQEPTVNGVVKANSPNSGSSMSVEAGESPLTRHRVRGRRAKGDTKRLSRIGMCHSLDGGARRLQRNTIEDEPNVYVRQVVK